MYLMWVHWLRTLPSGDASRRRIINILAGVGAVVGAGVGVIVGVVIIFAVAEDDGPVSIAVPLAPGESSSGPGVSTDTRTRIVYVNTGPELMEIVISGAVSGVVGAGLGAALVALRVRLPSWRVMKFQVPAKPTTRKQRRRRR